MKHNIILLLTTLTLLPLFAISQDKKDCNTIDHFIQATLKDIQNQDTNSYVNLASYDTLLAVLKAGSYTDTLQKQIYEQIKNNPDLFKRVFKQNFTRLTKNIRKDLQTDKWIIKLRDYKVTHSEKGNLTDHLSIKVNVEANGTDYNISMYLTKYKDCYYIFEPVDYYFSKY